MVNTYSGTTFVSGGTLALDFSNLTNPTNLISPLSPLMLNGGNLTLQGAAGQHVSQTLGLMTLGTDTGSVITLNAATAASVALTTGNVARGAGSTLDIETTGTTTLTTGAVH